MVVYDASGRPIAANPAFERLWGASLSDVPPDYSVLADPQLEGAGVLPLLRRAFGLDGARSPEGAGEAVTLPALRYDVATTTGRGHTLWTEAHAYPVRDAVGEVERVVLTHTDVTARKEAEAALRESEARYRALLNSLDEGFCIIEVLFDADGKPVDYQFLETNPAFVRQTGLVDAVGKRMRELAPQHEKHWFEAYGRVAVTGQAERFDAPATALDRWFDVYAFRIGQAEDRRVAVLFDEISEARASHIERERLLRALQVERSRLAYVFQHAPTFLAVLRGPQLAFEMVNDAYYRLVGHRELVGRPVFEALPELRGQGFEKLLEGVLETGEPFVGREVAIHLQQQPSGPLEERFLDFVYLPLVDPDGTRSGIIAHGTDVTDQVHSRRQVEFARDRATRLQTLTAALAAANTPAAIADVVVSRGIEATGAATALLALHDVVVGERSGERLPEAVIVRQVGLTPEILQEFARFPLAAPGSAAASMRTGEAFFLESSEEILARFPEIEALRKKMGSQAIATIPISVAGETIGAMSFTWNTPRTLTAGDREFFHTLAAQAGQALDRARLIAAERAARSTAEAAWLAAERARREADEANQAKTAFLATMSHEIRTPINAQIGYAQLMELEIAGPVTEKQREYLSRLTSSSEHLRNLVDDVLDLAKIDAKSMTVAHEPALTGAIVATALDLIRPLPSARGVRLIDERPGDPGEAFVGDEHRVRQVVVNLLSNAVKFTEAGGTVILTCGQQGETPVSAELRGGGPWTFIRVKDTGIGIPTAEQARIFEPFHQVDAGHTRQQGGTGLGLAISRRLARLMGGDLTVESAPRAGSTFTLWLPASAATGSTGTIETAAERGARARQDLATDRVQGLAEVGKHLRENIENVIAAYATRIRADPAFPLAPHLRRSELEDHQLSFLSDVAQTLVVIEETGGPESDLLRDGSTIQRVIAELHGGMRQRRGWTEEQLNHEYDILAEEIATLVKRQGPAVGNVSFALGILGRLVQRARAAGLAALRRSAEAGDGRTG